MKLLSIFFIINCLTGLILGASEGVRNYLSSDFIALVYSGGTAKAGQIEELILLHVFASKELPTSRNGQYFVSYRHRESKYPSFDFLYEGAYLVFFKADGSLYKKSLHSSQLFIPPIYLGQFENTYGYNQLKERGADFEGDRARQLKTYHGVDKISDIITLLIFYSSLLDQGYGTGKLYREFIDADLQKDLDIILSDEANFNVFNYFNVVCADKEEVLSLIDLRSGK